MIHLTLPTLYILSGEESKDGIDLFEPTVQNVVTIHREEAME